MSDSYIADQSPRITMTLSEILANTPPAQTLAQATDAPGAALEWMKTSAYQGGAWFGELGELGTNASRDSLFTGYLATGATCKVAGVVQVWDGYQWNFFSADRFIPTYTTGIPQVSRSVLNTGVSQVVALPTHNGAVRITWAGNGRFSYRMGISSSQAVISDAPAIAGSTVVLPVPAGATHLAVYGIGSGDCAIEGGA